MVRFMAEEISLAAFLAEVSRRARAVRLSRSTWAAPRAALSAFVETHPDTAEARLLVHLCSAIDAREGAFGADDIHYLSGEGLSIAQALADAAASGGLVDGA